jgi:hypothetical protein
MTEEAFRAKRRQKFLNEKYFEINKKWLTRLIQENEKVDESGLTSVDPAYPGVFGSTFKEKLNLLRLHYTAGEPIESLSAMHVDAMKWFDLWHVAYREHIQSLGKARNEELREDGSPLWFEDLFYFQLGLDIVSLAILLGEGEAVRHIATLLTRYRNTDMLFESIVEPAYGQPSSVEEFFHERPYDPLLDAIYAAKTPQEASFFVKAYLDDWYKSFEGAPWYNGHTVIADEYLAYEGYWAFEAAAVCVIYGIDDSFFRDHLVYPKDLADWARANGSLDKIKPSSGPHKGDDHGRCEANQPCPRDGYWFTPAQVGSRRHFKAGEVMPEFKSDYGATIWQWDAKQ